MTMKAIDLFSGIGGMSVALHPLGFTPVMYCDIEPASRITLTALMKNGKLPTAPIHDDIRTLKSPPKADLVTAGFPCLGFSPLGNRQGLKNPQSNLIYDVVRVVKKSGAKMVFLENHKNLITPAFASDFANIMDAFSKIGFKTARYVVMHGHDVGCPQSRSRVYILMTRPSCPKDLPYAQTPPFSWKTIPTTMSMQQCPPARVKLLGNSVIPDLTRLGFLHLWTGGQIDTLAQANLMKSIQFSKSIQLPRDGKGDVGEITATGSERTRYKKSIVPQTHLIPEIVVDPSLYERPATSAPGNLSSPLVTEKVHRKGFPTLTCAQTHGCQVLTKRSVKHLCTLLRFIKQTPSKLRCGRPNIHFYEWMMGYPTDWTSVN